MRDNIIKMPLAAVPTAVVANDVNDVGDPLCLATNEYSVGKFKASGVRPSGVKNPIWGHWIAVCR